MNCTYCKGEILKNDSEVLYVGNKFAHVQCYIEKMSKYKPETIQQRVEKYKEAYEEEITKREKKEKEKNIRIQVTDFIFSNYDVSFLPSYFYIRLASIYDGTFKGLKNPVPPEDLLDMWQQQIKRLNRIAVAKANKGEKINGIHRVMYDLAILISRHDEYLNWKERNRMEITRMKKEQSEGRVNSDLATGASPTTKSKTKIDIASTLNEI